MDYLKLLRCPVTKNDLDLIENVQFSDYKLPGDLKKFGQLTHGLIDKSKCYFYPVFNDIIVLHKQYATFLGGGENLSEDLSFDKKRVFDYYNEINFKLKDSFKIYEDSPRWRDYREISSNYLRNSFAKHHSIVQNNPTFRR